MSRDSEFALVIFDWDGTVVDTTLFAVQSAELACSEQGLPKPNLSEVEDLICRSPGKALSKAMPFLSLLELKQLVQRFQYYYLNRNKYLRPVEGMRQLILRLKGKGVPLAVATGKSRISLEKDMAATNLVTSFAATRTAEESEPKPSPRMVMELCKDLAVHTNQTLVVGDTCHDIAMAHHAGAKAVAVCYGAHARADLEKHCPLRCFNNASELDSWLQSD